MAFVVDTSAVIAWFIKDQATAYTNRLRERARPNGVGPHVPRRRIKPLREANLSADGKVTLTPLTPLQCEPAHCADRTRRGLEQLFRGPCV